VPSSKVFSSADEAVADIPAGAVIMVAGYAMPGTPQSLMKALLKKGVGGLTCISGPWYGRDPDLYDVARLVANGQVKKVITATPIYPHPLLLALIPFPSPTGGRREGDEGTGKGPALSLPKGRDVVNNIERTIILGDFNASPNSPEMLLLREAGLKDAFLAAFTLSPSPKSPQPPFSKGGQGGISTGRGEGRESGYTYPSHNPSRRIDYIWASSDLKVRDFTLADSLASDHLGVAVMVDR